MASGIVYNINSKIATLFINRATTLHSYAMSKLLWLQLGPKG
jgi:hypothetical protein